MPEGLQMWIGCIIAAIIIIVFTWMLFKYNPIYINYEIGFMKEGEIRWDKGSPKTGPGHRIDVITDIKKKKVLFIFTKYEISFDRYIKNAKGGYDYSESLVWSSGEFIRLTLPEPVAFTKNTAFPDGQGFHTVYTIHKTKYNSQG